MTLPVSTLAGLFGSGSTEGSASPRGGAGKSAATPPNGDAESFAAALLMAMGPKEGTGESVETVIRNFLSQDAGAGSLEGDAAGAGTEGDVAGSETEGDPRAPEAEGDTGGEKPLPGTLEEKGRSRGNEPRGVSANLTEFDAISANPRNTGGLSSLPGRSTHGLGLDGAPAPVPGAPSPSPTPSDPQGTPASVTTPEPNTAAAAVGTVRSAAVQSEPVSSSAVRDQPAQSQAPITGAARGEAVRDQASRAQDLRDGARPTGDGITGQRPSPSRPESGSADSELLPDAPPAAGPTGGTGPVPAPEHLLETDRDLSRLEPEFRHRLERVIRRMETEYGHRVEVVEGYRAPERQEFLYTQGRSRSGPVVTWTRDSLHSQGRAADLKIDGSWQNQQGYSRLQRIAREEGLGTLGAKDPGHLELPASAEKSGREESVRMASEPTRPWSTQAPGPNGARRVAAPARVARPAAVARVAAVASPGAGRATLRGRDGSTGPRPDPRPVDPEVSSGRGEEKDARGREGLGGDVVRTGPSQAEAISAGGGRSWAEPGVPKPVSPPSAPAATSAQRVEAIHSMKEASQMAPPRFMHLDLENADGAGTRLRLDLRGSNLDATIDLQDPVSAELMRARINGLHRSLARVGLDAESIRIQAPKVSLEGVERLREIQPGVAEAFRLTTLEGMTTSRSTNAEGRSQGHTAQGGQDQSRPGNPHQRNQEREERR